MANGSDPPVLNIPKLQSRAANAVDRRRRNAKAFKAGVSQEGQLLFQAITKT